MPFVGKGCRLYLTDAGGPDAGRIMKWHNVRGIPRFRSVGSPPNAMEIVGTGPAEAIEDDGLRLGDDVQPRVLQCDGIYSGSMGCGFYLADAHAD